MRIEIHFVKCFLRFDAKFLSPWRRTVIFGLSPSSSSVPCLRSAGRHQQGTAILHKTWRVSSHSHKHLQYNRYNKQPPPCFSKHIKPWISLFNPPCLRFHPSVVPHTAASHQQRTEYVQPVQNQKNASVSKRTGHRVIHNVGSSCGKCSRRCDIKKDAQHRDVALTGQPILF